MQLHSTNMNMIACVLLSGAPLLQGCASAERLAAIPYQVELVADNNVNPDLKGRPSSIEVIIYELRGDSTFESSNFFELENNQEKTLGRDLIFTDRIIIRPGEKRQFSRSGSIDARNIGIVAEYRNLESNHWRRSIPLPPPKQLNLYKFWQTSPDQMKVRVTVRNGGIELLPVSR